MNHDGLRFGILKNVAHFIGLQVPVERDWIRAEMARGVIAGYPPRAGSGDTLRTEGPDRLLREGERVRGNRGMLISAARSWLFNGFLARHLERGDAQEVAQGPLIGKSRDPQPGEEYFDETEQAWAAGLRKLGAKVDNRALIVRPGEMSCSFEEDALVLQFRLPPGSYATSLLRELFLVEDASL